MPSRDFQQYAIKFFAAFLFAAALNIAPLWALEKAPPASASTVAGASTEILNEARRILSVMKSSQYSHKTKIDEAAGKYEVDCSGLVCAILKKVAPQELKSIPHEKSRPLAFEFHDSFLAASPNPEESKGWVRVDKLIDAKPGDLIAWRREEIVAGENTGHIVIVEQPPVREDDGSIRVTVIDSTAGPHANDSRKDGATGVGRGTMWFQVDDAGRPRSYCWKSRPGKPHETPIAIGRLAKAQ